MAAPASVLAAWPICNLLRQPFLVFHDRRTRGCRDERFFFAQGSEF